MHTITVGMLLIEIIIIIMSLMSLVTCKNINQKTRPNCRRVATQLSSSVNYNKIIPLGLDKVMTPDGK